jgi:hypothetical protein
VRELLTAAAGRAIRYLETLDARPVSPTPQAIAALSQLDEPLPEMPDDPAAILARLDEIGSPASMAMAGRRWLGDRRVFWRPWPPIGGNVGSNMALTHLPVLRRSKGRVALDPGAVNLPADCAAFRHRRSDGITVWQRRDWRC